MEASSGIQDLADLRVPPLKYTELLVQRLMIQKKEIETVFIPNSILTFSQAYSYISRVYSLEGKVFTEEDIIVFYDLANFPIDPKSEIILDKLSYSDDMSHCVYLKGGARFFSGIYCCSFNSFQELSKTDMKLLGNLNSKNALQIDITDFFARIDDTKSILHLFSNNFQLRHFNTIKDDGLYFEKQSSNGRKLRDEYNFLCSIPIELRPFFPNVGKGSGDQDDFKYQIEKIFAFDASKLLLNGVFFEKNKLDFFLDNLSIYFYSVPTQKIDINQLLVKLNKICLNKNIERVNAIYKLEQAAQLEAI